MLTLQLTECPSQVIERTGGGVIKHCSDVEHGGMGLILLCTGESINWLTELSERISGRVYLVKMG